MVAGFFFVMSYNYGIWHICVHSEAQNASAGENLKYCYKTTQKTLKNKYRILPILKLSSRFKYGQFSSVVLKDAVAIKLSKVQ